MSDINAEGINFHKLSDALFFFEKVSVPVVEGTTCQTSDGKFVFKNGEWEPINEVD